MVRMCGRCLLVGALLVSVSGCAQRPEAVGKPSADASQRQAAQNGADERLIVDDLSPGEGPTVKPDSWVVVQLTGEVLDGPVFQRMTSPAGPWPVDSLIPGLARGMQGMAEGGLRRITIPPELAYGDTPVVDEDTGEVLVPPGSTLVYEVALVEVSVGTADEGDVAEPNSEAQP